MSRNRSPKSSKRKSFRLPSKVTILGKAYTVRLDPTLMARRQAHGMCDPARKQILLNPTDDLYLLKTTLIHEMMHAALAQSGLTNAIKLPIEESICQMVEDWLVEIIDFSKLK